MNTAGLRSNVRLDLKDQEGCKRPCFKSADGYVNIEVNYVELIYLSDCLKGHKCQVNGTKIKQVIIYFKATYFSALKCRRYNRVVLLLFQQLGSELTALADGRGPGALRAREAINSTPTANTNHHHRELLQ